MKKTKLTHYFSWCLLWAVLFSILCIPAVHAGDKFIIKPMFISTYEMDSNFYKTNAGERSVSTLTVSPGLEFGYRTEKSQVTATGVLNFVYYDDQDDVPPGLRNSDDNDYTGHRLTLSADTQLFTRISLGINDSWINTRNPEERDRFDNFTDVNEYMINTFGPWLKYKITDRISAGLSFTNTRIDFDESTEEDSEHSGVLLDVGLSGVAEIHEAFGGGEDR